MIQVWKIINGYKTYIVGWSTVAFAVIGILLGQIEFAQGVEIANLALIGMGIRHGVSKIETPAL